MFCHSNFLRVFLFCTGCGATFLYPSPPADPRPCNGRDFLSARWRATRAFTNEGSFAASQESLNRLPPEALRSLGPRRYGWAFAEVSERKNTEWGLNAARTIRDFRAGLPASLRGRKLFVEVSKGETRELRDREETKVIWPDPRSLARIVVGKEESPAQKHNTMPLE